ncbi:phosphofructokinase [Aliidiomarina iranensis]|uniref:Phosphofructokinase n=1 Tax=Aliidiomarina iranensis TaxID=1434071 RepID=A0A432VZV0_9GAMM|nr:hexose kinase [Aliidiomarina iranensis]RUO22268.1 phosphofructokinase [Aliidiomarina iranensis]
MSVPIITFTMNPAVDTFGETERIFDDSKSRCQQSTQEPGGGGINVARNINRMGGQALAIFPAGGLNGELLKQLLARDNTPFQAIPIKADTRQNLAISERYSGKMFHFVFPGPELTQLELDNCWKKIFSQPEPPRYLILSGSIADSLPPDFYGDITTQANQLGSKVILDSSGAALHGALYHDAFLAKLNRKEFSSLGYSEHDGLVTLAEQMRERVKSGAARNLIVTLAKGGALMVTQTGETFAFMPPKVEIVSHVGAGDSFVSALTFQLMQGTSIVEAFRYGVAAACVTVQTRGNQLYDLALLEDIYKKTQPLAFTR